MDGKKQSGFRLSIGPILCAAVMVVWMAGLIWLMAWAFQADPAGAPPPALMALLFFLPALVIVGVVVALAQRLREIGRREEEEARRY